jgi:hypothetical protein
MAVLSNHAILNLGRLNAFRLNYIPQPLKSQRDQSLAITLDGAPLRMRYRSLTVKDVINDAPNTCTLIVDNATPPTLGKRLRVVLGVDPAYLLFAGPLQATRATYVGRSNLGQREWLCEAIDDTQRSDWMRPFGAWENVSASTVAQQLVASFAPGFSAAGVQPGLPPVTLYLDGTERMGGAMKLIAKLIGGYYYFEDMVLHLFVGSESGARTPDDVDGRPHQLIDDPSITYTVDDSQIRTRIYGKGHGEPTLTAVDAGETRLPIANAVMFNPGGGKAIAEWQRIAYGQTVLGGGGAAVGPGVTPSAPPILAVADGTGVDAGAHTYAYTWVTAAGETNPSPVAAVTLTGGTVAAPSFSVSQGIAFGGPPAGTTINYQMFIADGATNGLYSLGSAILGLVSNGNRPQLFFTTTVDMRGRIVSFFRQDNGGLWSPVPIVGGPVGSSTFNPYPISQPPGYGQQWTDQLVNYTGGSASAPGPNNGPLTGGTVAVSGISAGPSGVTGRKVYRSAANLTTPLKLATTLADNTTTTFVDNKADTTLGATAPAGDTSGLQMAAGQVLPGATVMPISGSAWVVSGGGWAVIGNGAQVIRYGGLQGGIALSGIPATGNGAITAPVNYNSTITGAPMLVGVAGIANPMREGTPVNIWTQIDDTAAQTAFAARVGGNGIVEHLIVDERRGEPSLLALSTADIAQYATPVVTVRYATFDPKSKSGRPVRINLPSLLLDVVLMIQDVTIDNIGVGPSLPRFTVYASGVRSSLEDILRRLVGTLEEGF